MFCYVLSVTFLSFLCLVHLDVSKGLSPSRGESLNKIWERHDLTKVKFLPFLGLNRACSLGNHLNSRQSPAHKLHLGVIPWRRVKRGTFCSPFLFGSFFVAEALGWICCLWNRESHSGVGWEVPQRRLQLCAVGISLHPPLSAFPQDLDSSSGDSTAQVC